MFVGVNIPDLPSRPRRRTPSSSARMFLSHPSTFITASDPRIFGDQRDRHPRPVDRHATTRPRTTAAVRRRRPVRGSSRSRSSTSAASRSPTRPTSRTSTSTPRRAPGIETLVGLGLADLTVGQLVIGTTEFLTRDGDINQEDLTNDAVGAWAGMELLPLQPDRQPGRDHFELPADPDVLARLIAERERAPLGLLSGAPSGELASWRGPGHRSVSHGLRPSRLRG